MRKLHVPADVDWELLVVDNNSPDDTQQVLKRFQNVLPLRSLYESNQGQCWARNAAIREARGEVLLWTDDDVLVDSQWVAEYVRAADEHPQVTFFGGTIEPWFEEPPPALLAASLEFLQGPFAIRSLGLETRLLASGELPFGANMAFRTEALRRYLFNTSIGHVGSNPRGGDEVDVMERMLADGLVGLWVGSAKVRHFVPKERANVTYLRQWFHSSGSVVARDMAAVKSRTIFGVPRYVMRQYVQARLARICCAPAGGKKWLRAMLRSEQLGSAIACYRSARKAAVASAEELQTSV
jgi:glycosyltransferase involved in cell wall biosynthesis